MRRLPVVLVAVVGLFVIGLISILNIYYNPSTPVTPRPDNPQPWIDGPSIDKIQFNPHITIPRSYGVALEKLQLSVEIDQGVAKIEIRESLRNVGGGKQEVEFIYPLPEGAQVEDFTLRDGDTVLKAQVLDAGQARSIYNSIVSQMKDPGLLEYIGRGAIRIAAFPFDPNQTRELRFQYRQPLVQDQGFYKLTVAIKALNRMPGIIRPLYNFRPAQESPYIPHFLPNTNLIISATVKDTRALTGLYSPTHDIYFRPDNGALKGTFESTQPEILENFTLNYRTTSSTGLAGSLIAYPSGAATGYFMLQIDPGQNKSTKIQPKDVVFVIDISGSMMGEKIEQARQAVKSVLGTLNAGDRYSIVEFSDIASPWYEKLVEVDNNTIRKDQEKASMIQSSGGTNIGEALSVAGKLLRNGSKNRASYILFATDGMPTVGEQDSRKLVSMMRERIPRNVRLYSFGVGTDVNANLLDEMSMDHRGNAVYMGPNDNIEIQISSFARMIRAPYIVGPDIRFSNLKILNTMPEPIPDFYAETMTYIYGRYQGNLPRSTSIVIHSEDGRSFELNCPVISSPSNSYIARLWAGQRVAYLLRKMQLKGEEPNMIREITQLATEYGIVTPYTSYLITEGNQITSAQQMANVRNQRESFADKASGTLANLAARARQGFNGPPPPGGGTGGGPSGAPSVNQAKQMSKDVASEMGIDEESVNKLQNRNGIAFYLQTNVWVDGRITPENKAKIIRLNVYSEEAQKIIENSELVRNSIDLVNFKVLVNDKLILELTEDDEKPSAAQLRELYKALNIK